MSVVLRTVLGFLAAIFFVIRPMQANFISSLAKRAPIGVADKAILLTEAARIDNCNPDILNDLGDAYISIQNPAMGAIAYGRIMECSPGNSLVRFKFGESLLMLNFLGGRENIKEALRLEPHNPIYKSEIERLTAFR